MPAYSEIQRLSEELSELRRIVRGSHRMGTVVKNEKGRTQVSFQQGDLGDEGGKATSAWIRTGHGGAVSEDRIYTEGEVVHVFAAGGNLEHAHLTPGGYSESQPLDKNADGKANVRRWRKPPEKQQGQQGDKAGAGSGGSKEGQYGEDKSDRPKWKDDDENDHTEKVSHEGRQYKLGKAEEALTKDMKEIKFDKFVCRVSKDGAVLTDGKATLTVKDGKIILDGEVHLGGSGGKKIGIVGTLDARGDPLVEGGAASKVYAV